MRHGLFNVGRLCVAQMLRWLIPSFPPEAEAGLAELSKKDQLRCRRRDRHWQPWVGLVTGFAFGMPLFALHIRQMAILQRMLTLLRITGGFDVAMVIHILTARYFGLIELRKMFHCRSPICGYDLRATPERCPECGAVAKLSQYSN